jgi:hypothetical protein
MRETQSIDPGITRRRVQQTEVTKVGRKKRGELLG